MHRILKPTGSLYLHCDPTASHYLKAMLDAVFGKKQFRNNIIWAYTGAEGFQYQTLVPAQARRHPLLCQERQGGLCSTVTLYGFRVRGAGPNLMYEYKVFPPHSSGWTRNAGIR